MIKLNNKGQPGDGKKELQQAIRAFNRYLKDQGFIVKSIRADGNCLFRSVAHQVSKDDNCHVIYRELAVDHIKNNENTFSSFMDDKGDGGFERYIQKMSKPGEWGGHLELLALSQALFVKFCLITETHDTIWVNMNQDDNVKVLYLAFHRSRCHYFSIVKESNILSNNSLSQLYSSRDNTNKENIHKESKNSERSKKKKMEVLKKKKKKACKNFSISTKFL